MNPPERFRLARLAVVVSLCLGALHNGANDLETGFSKPPEEAKPHTWWHWCNGNDPLLLSGLLGPVAINAVVEALFKQVIE